MAADSLPAGWEMHVSKSKGKPYYVNTATGERLWRPPNASGTSAIRKSKSTEAIKREPGAINELCVLRREELESMLEGEEYLLLSTTGSMPSLPENQQAVSRPGAEQMYRSFSAQLPVANGGWSSPPGSGLQVGGWSSPPMAFGSGVLAHPPYNNRVSSFSSSSSRQPSQWLNPSAPNRAAALSSFATISAQPTAMLSREELDDPKHKQELAGAIESVRMENASKAAVISSGAVISSYPMPSSMLAPTVTSAVAASTMPWSLQPSYTNGHVSGALSPKFPPAAYTSYAAPQPSFSSVHSVPRMGAYRTGVGQFPSAAPMMRTLVAAAPQMSSRVV